MLDRALCLSLSLLSFLLFFFSRRGRKEIPGDEGEREERERERERLRPFPSGIALLQQQQQQQQQGGTYPLTRNKNSSSSQRYFRCLSDIPWTLALFVFSSPLVREPRKSGAMSQTANGEKESGISGAFLIGRQSVLVSRK